MLRRLGQRAALGIPVGEERARHCHALRRGRLPLALALLALLGCALALAALAGGDPLALDLRVARALARLDRPALAWLLGAVSWLGWQPQATLLGLGVVLALFRRGLPLESGFAGLALVTGTPVYLGLSLWSRRPRPAAVLDVFGDRHALVGASFPSGHVINYVLFCGFLAYLAHTLLRSAVARRLLLAFLLGLVALIGPSRLVLGQHWFSGVLVSYLLGFALLLALLAAYRAAKRLQLARVDRLETGPSARRPGSNGRSPSHPGD